MLTVSHLSKSYVLQNLFENISFSLNPGERLGLVGATLWLGVVLHSVMAVWCFRCLRMRKVTTAREAQ